MPCSHGRRPGGGEAVSPPHSEAFSAPARRPSPPPSRCPSNQTPCFFILASVEADGPRLTVPFQLPFEASQHRSVSASAPPPRLRPTLGRSVPGQEKNKGVFPFG